MLIKANAKINLHLEIKKERNDGFHEIDSIFQSVSLADYIEIEKSASDQYLGTLVSPLKNEELIYKAHQAVKEYTGKKLHCKITLCKNIPISAGLGGGSADAAGVVIGLNLLFKLDLKSKDLIKIAEKIGSDVPFFIVGGTCHVTGRGEKIKPINIIVSPYFILARPHKRISTKVIFDNHRRTKRTFFDICAEICPEIDRLRQHFLKYKTVIAGLSGSGPTMFCGVGSYDLATKIVYELKDFDGDIFITEPASKGIEIIRL